MELTSGLDVTPAEEAHAIPKPWGRELWLTTPDFHGKYVFKIIEVNAGHKLSLQYHEKKIETMYIMEGEANLHYKDSPEGENKIQKLTPGAVVQCRPQAIHRIEAITNVKIVEASTCEVEDVVRLEDGYGREGTSDF